MIRFLFSDTFSTWRVTDENTTNNNNNSECKSSRDWCVFGVSGIFVYNVKVLPLSDTMTIITSPVKYYVLCRTNWWIWLTTMIWSCIDLPFLHTLLYRVYEYRFLFVCFCFCCCFFFRIFLSSFQAVYIWIWIEVRFVSFPYYIVFVIHFFCIFNDILYTVRANAANFDISRYINVIGVCATLSGQVRQKPTLFLLLLLLLFRSMQRIDYSQQRTSIIIGEYTYY